jgi:NitT/TauT family transport system substrate-binding protein
MSMTQTRRRFLTTLSMAGAAGLVRAPPSLAGEGTLETTAVRFAKFPGLCIAPQYIVGELLRAEGFTEISYEDVNKRLSSLAAAVARDEADFSLDFAAHIVLEIDKGGPVTVLSGVHVGCLELFGQEEIRGIADLKGKSVGANLLGLQDAFLTAMAGHVGLDPVRDINWVSDSAVKPMELFAQGKLDAFLATPPEPQELRDRHIGHVIFSSTVDRPWSQYFLLHVGQPQ